MNRIGMGIAAASTLLLAGCVGYGYPSDGYYGGGYSNPGAGYPGDYGYGNQGGRGDVVRCESSDRRTRHCNVDTRGGVRLVRQLSDARCIEGSTWGTDRNGIWVTQGCRAEFALGGGYRPGPGTRPGHGQGRTVRCESRNDRHQRCDVSVRGDVTLVRQLSDARCIRGSSWGWDRNGIWVDRGCRAEFSVR